MEKITVVKTETEELLKKISLHLEFIDSQINICKDNFELECKDKLNDLNSLCNDLHMKMQGINLNIGISDIIPTSTSNNMGGTSIEDLLKQRQCEEIEQIIIDSIDIKPDIMIDDVQY